MESSPPPLPPAVLQRVLSIAQLDGITVTVVAGLGLVVAGGMRDITGLSVAAMILLAGLIELLGVRKLRRRDLRGLNLLVRSQLLLLLVIWGYVGLQLLRGSGAILDTVLTPDRMHQLARLGVDSRQLKELIRQLLPMTYIVVALATLVYQGGLAWWYRRQRRIIQTITE